MNSKLSKQIRQLAKLKAKMLNEPTHEIKFYNFLKKNYKKYKKEILKEIKKNEKKIQI
jgi:hypothetical protein